MQLEFLSSLYRLEGSLQYNDTRELFDGFVVDYFHMLSAECIPPRIVDRSNEDQNPHVNQEPAVLAVSKECYEVANEVKGVPSKGLFRIIHSCTVTVANMR